MSKTTGTKEWSDTNVNIQIGCKNGCNYCYAMKMAMRFKHVKSYTDWINPEIDCKKVTKKFNKRIGRIMFPSTHDITTRNYESCIVVLKNMLKAGNEVLIVSKPNPLVIDILMQKLVNFKDQIQFRFTITSLDNIDSLWQEPNAPLPKRRIQALMWAFQKGWKTSVSIEPYLDADLVPLIKKVEPLCTESIWVGIMGHGVPESLKPIYTRSHIRANINGWLKAGNEKLRLKDRIVNMGFRITEEGNLYITD